MLSSLHQLIMWSHLELLLSEEPSVAQSETEFYIQDKNDGTSNSGASVQPMIEDPISSMGSEGSGSPWWIWIVVGLLAVLLGACLGVACYRRKQKVQQETKDDGLDEPLFLPASSEDNVV